MGITEAKIVSYGILYLNPSSHQCQPSYKKYIAVLTPTKRHKLEALGAAILDFKLDGASGTWGIDCKPHWHYNFTSPNNGYVSQFYSSLFTWHVYKSLFRVRFL